MALAWGLLALAGGLARAESPKGEARQIGGVLDQLYPNQNLSTKASRRATTDTQVAEADTPRPATRARKTTPTLVLRRGHRQPALPRFEDVQTSSSRDARAAGSAHGSTRPDAAATTATATARGLVAGIPLGDDPAAPDGIGQAIKTVVRDQDRASSPTRATVAPPVADGPTTASAKVSSLSRRLKAVPDGATWVLPVRPLTPSVNIGVLEDRPTSGTPMPRPGIKSAPGSIAGTGAATATGRVSINQASERELRERLKIDARRARLIVEFRRTYGRFRQPEDLGQVNGITDDMVRRWEDKNLLQFD